MRSDRQASAEVTVADGDHNEIGRLRRSDFRHITICTVTLDAFTSLAARAQQSHSGSHMITINWRSDQVDLIVNRFLHQFKPFLPQVRPTQDAYRDMTSGIECCKT